MAFSDWLRSLVLIPLFLTCWPSEAAAFRLELAPPFREYMVLQRDCPVPVWGLSAEGEVVTIQFADSTVKATADENGFWRGNLPPLAASSTPGVLRVQGNTHTVKVANVLVGDVWLCVGDSNLARTLSQDAEVRKAFPGAPGDPQDPVAGNEASAAELRLFTVENRLQSHPVFYLNGRWNRCTPSAAQSFSALAYWFGKALRKANPQVPVGLICSAWGGTTLEPWLPSAVLEKHEQLAHLLEQQEDQARRPPGIMYNAMVAPLSPFALCGVLWNQGAMNADRAWQYRTLFPLLIESYRKQWEKPDLPFLYAQVPPYRYLPKRWDKEFVAEIREAQVEALSIPRTGMASTMDLSDLRDVHLLDKQRLGRRLALLARATALGEKVVHQGPTFKKLEVKGKEVHVHFDHCGDGLRTLDGKSPNWFTLAGEKPRDYRADARLEGNTVILTSRRVPEPKSVRFAWQDDATPNLVNSAGLPALPFRTDKRPWLTKENR